MRGVGISVGICATQKCFCELLEFKRALCVYNSNISG